MNNTPPPPFTVPTRTERSPHPPCVCVVRRRGIHCVFTGFLLARVQHLREISVFKSQSPLIATFFILSALMTLLLSVQSAVVLRCFSFERCILWFVIHSLLRATLSYYNSIVVYSLLPAKSVVVSRMSRSFVFFVLLIHVHYTYNIILFNMMHGTLYYTW